VNGANVSMHVFASVEDILSIYVDSVAHTRANFEFLDFLTFKINGC